jgi:ribosomal protein L24E
MGATHTATCKWCGRKYQKGNNALIFIKLGSDFCSKKCETAYNAGHGNQSDNSRKVEITDHRTSEQITAQAEAEAIKRQSKMEAEAARKKRMDDDNDQFFDSIKKLFLGKKNKAAKELHSQLEEIEADIRIAISKGDLDEAGKLIRQLKHDSNLFVPKTNTSYSKYWADKREECLNKL